MITAKKTTKKKAKKIVKKTTKKKTSHKMKSYASFDLWAKAQKPVYQDLVRIIRKLIKAEFPKLEEEVKWGNGCWSFKKLPIVFLYADKDHIQFGFFAGAMLKDPKNLLEGKGKFVRAIKLRDKKDIDKEYAVKLIRQAIKIKYR